MRNILSTCFALFFFTISYAQLPPVCFNTLALSSTEPSYQDRMCTADFNSDGKADLAVGSLNASNIGSLNIVSVLIGNGNGTFASAVTYSVGLHPRSVCSADFNGDGKPDIASANYFSTSVSILLNSGTGTFNTAVNYSVTNGAVQDVVSSDFNNDGKADLAVILSGNSSTKFYIFLGNGFGGFSAPTSFYAPTPGIQYSAITSDFNSDGKMDLAIANSGGNDNVAVYLGTGIGTFSLSAYYNCISTNAHFLTAADFNNDGKSDIAASGTSNISVFINTGTGTFSPAVSYGSLSTIGGIKSADFNSDGKFDLAIANNSSSPNGGIITILLGSGTGSFNTQYDFIGSANNSNFDIVTADFNGDTKPDVAITTSSSSPGYIAVALNSIAPTITVVATNTAICAGYSTTLTALGPNSYTWNGSVYNPSIAVSPLVNTSYTIHCKFAGGCTNTAVYTVTVNPNPTITVNSGSVCSGQSFTLNPVGASTYTFTGGNSVVNPLTNTNYSVTGTSSAGCVGTNTAVSTVVVQSSPTVNVTSTDSILCLGSSATLSASGATSFTWNTGSNANPVIISPTVNTNYTVTGSSANGCTNTSILTQSVTDCTATGLLLFDRKNVELLIFPNPTNGQINIICDKKVEISVGSILGETLLKQLLNKGKNTIDLSNEPDGVYFIRTENTIFKFIKQ